MQDLEQLDENVVKDGKMKNIKTIKRRPHRN